MKFNWIVRFKNRNFWIGLIGVVFCAMGVDASMFTSWGAVFDAIISLVSNPFMLFSVGLALWGYVQDFTTKGVCDTKQVMTYTKPRSETDTEDDDSSSEDSEIH